MYQIVLCSGVRSFIPLVAFVGAIFPTSFPAGFLSYVMYLVSGTLAGKLESSLE